MIINIVIISLLVLVLVTNLVIIFRKNKTSGDKELHMHFQKQNEITEKFSKMQIDNIKAYNESVYTTITQQNYLQK